MLPPGSADSPPSISRASVITLGTGMCLVSVTALHRYLCGMKPTVPFVGWLCSPAGGFRGPVLFLLRKGQGRRLGLVQRCGLGPRLLTPQSLGAAREPGVSADEWRGLGTGEWKLPLGGRTWVHVFMDRAELADTLSTSWAGAAAGCAWHWVELGASGMSWHRGGHSS